MPPRNDADASSGALSRHAIDIDSAADDATAPPEDDLRHWISTALDRALADRAGPAEVSVRVVDADEIRTLNREYRHRDRPTNVLSFPVGEVPGLPQGEPVPLGDVVVCASVVADEAAEQGKAVADHWAHMIVHGVLHLLGHDHAEDAEARAMEGLERRILGEFGVADPYA